MVVGSNVCFDLAVSPVVDVIKLMRSFLLILLAFSCTGCSLLKSRYAMEDKVYAKKYRKGAKKVDLLGKLKQASDARHTQFLTGYTVGGGAQMESESGVPLGLVEVGGEFYVTNYFASRVAVTGFTGSENLFVGGDIGARLQTPTRLAPFVGVGAAFGVGVFDALDIA